MGLNIRPPTDCRFERSRLDRSRTLDALPALDSGRGSSSQTAEARVQPSPGGSDDSEAVAFGRAPRDEEDSLACALGARFQFGAVLDVVPCEVLLRNGMRDLVSEQHSRTIWRL